MPATLLDALMPQGSLPDHRRAAIVARITDHPAATFIDPIRLTGAIGGLPRAFVRGTGGSYGGELGDDPVEPVAARARSEG